MINIGTQNVNKHHNRRYTAEYAAKGVQKKEVKRLLTAREICELLGENPIRNIIRNANAAEKLGDHSTAVRGWQEVQSYLEAKRKPIDPAESALKHKQVATLEELTRIKTAILAGTVAAIDEATGLEAEMIEHKGNADHLL